MRTLCCGGYPRTHAWAFARALIADPANEVLVSVVSLWQTVIKQRVGKLNADMALLLEVIKRNGFRNLAITRTHLLTLADLPLHHRDPFDHLLIAQAISERATFLSDDHHVARYAVRALKCSAPM